MAVSERIQNLVLNTFLNYYPTATYDEVLDMLETDRVEYLDWYNNCAPRDIREAMMYLYVDIQNLISLTICEYEKGQKAIQHLQCKCTNKDRQVK